MKSSRIALIISLALHGLGLLLFINYKFDNVYKKASGSVSVDITKITDPKLLVKRQVLEPVKMIPMQRTTSVTPTNRQIELTTAVKFNPTRAERGAVALKGSQMPTDLRMPAGTGMPGNFSARDFRPGEHKRILTERKSQLVNFVDKQKGKREIVYCLDVSASMSAPGSNKLNLAGNYLVESLGALTEQDSFNIVVFSRDTKLFNARGTVQATKENVSKAVEFLNQFTPQNTKSNIKTDLLNAVVQALGMKPNLVVVVTDGLPTVGVIQPEKILQSIRDANLGAKIFSIGMEMDPEQPETWLMKTIAEQNNGEFQLL